jgi:hypothetical protein
LSSIIQKIVASLINGGFIFLITLPIGLANKFSTGWKFSFIIIFYIYEALCGFIKGKRDIGMIIESTHWEQEPSLVRYLFYNIFYSLSFGSMLFYFKYPFDLLIINLIVLQLPSYLIFKKTFHGLLTNMVTIKL